MAFKVSFSRVFVQIFWRRNPTTLVSTFSATLGSPKLASIAGENDQTMLEGSLPPQRVAPTAANGGVSQLAGPFRQFLGSLCSHGRGPCCSMVAGVVDGY